MLRLTAAIVFAVSFTPVLAGENCTCRYQENDVNEGETICMKTPNGTQMATCSRVLNNTSWKFHGVPCPVSSNTIEHNQTDFDTQKVEILLAAKQSDE